MRGKGGLGFVFSPNGSVSYDKRNRTFVIWVIIDGGICSHDIKLHLRILPFPLLLILLSIKAAEKSFSMELPLFSHSIAVMNSLYSWVLAKLGLSEFSMI